MEALLRSRTSLVGIRRRGHLLAVAVSWIVLSTTPVAAANEASDTGARGLGRPPLGRADHHHLRDPGAADQRPAAAANEAPPGQQGVAAAYRRARGSGGGLAAQRGPLPRRRRGPDRAHLPVSPRRNLHLRQRRLLPVLPAHAPRNCWAGNFWSFVPPESQQVGRDTWPRSTPDRPVATCDHEVVAPGGEVRWQQWTDRGFFDEQGRVVEYQSVGRDITDLKRAEEQKLQLEAQKQAAAALREADKRKDQFLAMVSHELRDPLASMNMALALMRGEPMPSDDSRCALDVMGRQINKLNRLVDDLLDVARITSSKINAAAAPLDLRHVAAEAVETSRPWLLARQQTLSEEMPPSALMVSGDAVRLTQVVSNLLSNASKYSPDWRKHPVVLAPGRRSQIVLAVSDNGIGISVDLLDRVFGPFVQLGDPPGGRPGWGWG